MARPWFVIRYPANFAWSSASNSVQSSATTIPERSPTTNAAHGRNSAYMSKPGLLSIRSGCFTPCFALPFVAWAYPRPIA